MMISSRVRISLAIAIISTWAVTVTAQNVRQPTAVSKAEIAKANESCLECHDDMTDKITFANGNSRVVEVKQKTWLKSIHGERLACTDCHRNISKHPHPKTKYGTERDFRLAMSETCQRCHYAQYTRVLDGIHYETLKDGNAKAPNCVDCHGAHDIQSVKATRVDVSHRCGQCHKSVYEEFKKSVHGQALINEKNMDVPVCTDCHGAHSITSTSEGAFGVNSYKACANCHGDEKKMAPYKLNTAVLNTFLDDFHGASNKLYALGAGTPQKPIATCTDCHGTHDIQSFKAGAGTANMRPTREKVVKTCQKCHKDAPVAFADAWLSHYEPTLQTAPLVWIVKMVYKVMIPLMVLGLVLHILLHLWRLRKHR